MVEFSTQSAEEPQFGMASLRDAVVVALVNPGSVGYAAVARFWEHSAILLKSIWERGVIK